MRGGLGTKIRGKTRIASACSHRETLGCKLTPRGALTEARDLGFYIIESVTYWSMAGRRKKLPGTSGFLWC